MKSLAHFAFGFGGGIVLAAIGALAFIFAGIFLPTTWTMVPYFLVLLTLAIVALACLFAVVWTLQQVLS